MIMVCIRERSWAADHSIACWAHDWWDHVEDREGSWRGDRVCCWL